MRINGASPTALITTPPPLTPPDVFAPPPSRLFLSARCISARRCRRQHRRCNHHLWKLNDELACGAAPRFISLKAFQNKSHHLRHNTRLSLLDSATVISGVASPSQRRPLPVSSVLFTVISKCLQQTPPCTLLVLRATCTHTLPSCIFHQTSSSTMRNTETRAE